MKNRLSLLLLLALATVACTNDHDVDDEKNACIPGTNEGCDDGFVCEPTTYDEEPACFAPVSITGRVFDLQTDEGIADALVVARDANGAAAGPVAITDVDGTYSLTLPVERTDEEGNFHGQVLTLRVDAMDYQSYPGSFRPSLPVDLDDATKTEEETGQFVVDTPTTDVALIALSENEDNGVISGVVPEGAGALVVATNGGNSVTGVADIDGTYSVLNVPPGSYTLKAYAGGHQYDQTAADVLAEEETEDVDFQISDSPLATVSGNVNIVNAPGGSMTSVVLVVEDTFVESFARGEVPVGLRVGEVSGAFTIEGVPNGRYVVLAAFENDSLVRDPDTSIAGTQIVHIEVSGDEMNVPEAFKVTEALEINKPGAEIPEAISGTPTFSWADDSSEDAYSVVVYDAFGQLTWEDHSLGKISGQLWVELEYGGPALEPGMYYQWRATSLKDGVPISTTEDLRGLFYLSE